MKFNKALPGLTSLLLLAGCGKPPEPPGPETPRLTTVSVSCTPSVLTAGQTAQCAASAVDQNGEPFSVSAYTWTSGDESIARVDASGKVATVNVSSGTVAIRARADSTQGEASLAVAAKAPTVHSTPVTASETWKAQDNPHLVSGAVSVESSAMLTLEPGAVIRFAPDAELKVVRGSLQAPGTAQAPVLLQAEKGGKGAWKGVVLAAKDMASSLEFTTLSGCGGTQGAGACLVLRDGAAPVLKDVTVRESGSLGVLVATADSAFGTGSTRLSVSNSAGAAVRLDANQGGSLPTGGSFTGNTPNVVELTGTRLSRTQTWPNPGIPYVINQRLYMSGKASLATLTVAAGTQVRFGSDGQLRVGFEVTSSQDRGDLVLDGTEAARVLFTADSDNPQPGHWGGVHVVARPASKSRLAHATIEFAGKPPPEDESGLGNLNIYGDGENVPITVIDLVVQKSASVGVDLSEGGGFGPGSAKLTSRNNATYPLLALANTVRTIPRDIDFRDNGYNFIWLWGAGIVTTQTWPNLGLPYLLREVLFVGGSANPTLTLAPGTEIRASPGAVILVGYYDGQPGALVAEGTADAPIRFVPDSASATNGFWSGLHFWRATGSRLDRVLVTHGGGAPAIAYSGVKGSGNVNVHMNIGNFVTRSTFKNANKCAVTVDSGLTVSLTDASLGNIFVDNPQNIQCTD